MKEVKIKINNGIMPKKATDGSAAYDLFCPRDFIINGEEHVRGVVPLGFQVQMPADICMNIRPRSGFTLKGFEVNVNYYDEFGHIVHEDTGVRIDADCKIGLVDSDYVKNEVGVLFQVNSLDFPKPNKRYAYFKFIIPEGTRLAQAQFEFVPSIEFIECEELDCSNDRGGGFGHTGAI